MATVDDPMYYLCTPLSKGGSVFTSVNSIHTEAQAGRGSSFGGKASLTKLRRLYRAVCAGSNHA